MLAASVVLTTVRSFLALHYWLDGMLGHAVFAVRARSNEVLVSKIRIVHFDFIRLVASGADCLDNDYGGGCGNFRHPRCLVLIL